MVLFYREIPFPHLVFLIVNKSTQINSVEIQNPRLTSILPRRLTDAFNSLPRLETVTILDPTALHSFPHPRSLRTLKLRNIPPDCDDWQWLENVHNLTNLDVSLAGNQAGSGSLQVRLDVAELKSVAEIQTVSVLITVLSHLPMRLKKLNISIAGTNGTNLLFLNVDGDVAKLTNASEEEVSLAIVNVVGRLSEYLLQEVCYIGCVFVSLSEMCGGTLTTNVALLVHSYNDNS